MAATNEPVSVLTQAVRAVPDDLGAFIASMPEAYAQRHEEGEIREHARIVGRRAGAAVHLELCRGGDGDEQWLCVVADDRPGLLSLLSAAITAHSLDILSARVYCRERPGAAAEAVDLFSLRRIKPPYHLDSSGTLLESLGRAIESLLGGDTDVATLLNRGRPTPRPAGVPSSVVYFQDAEDADLLVVQAPDRPGLLLTITLIVFREKLTIAASHVTTFAETARDQFELRELDGSRLGPARRESIVRKVREALTRQRD